MVVVWILAALVVATVVVIVVAAFLSKPDIKVVTWKDGERWVRVHPNPGFRIAENVQWSAAHGKGRR